MTICIFSKFQSTNISIKMKTCQKWLRPNMLAAYGPQLPAVADCGRFHVIPISCLSGKIHTENLDCRIWKLMFSTGVC